ncbi:Endonuclease III conserved site-2 [Penicillium angulare]|uniref:Endonuclease III conserved site-2 n=1 Tax=Penicillium angulare TaxID=116970 RepID=UPI00254039A6|nr:Endonuclease III conserved site-2 [Penicillium angulare]KAJ5280524.1 Endonuclease III conserved site-2 [Penicillium angulare]
MRTSKTAKETSKVLQALSPPARRSTRNTSLTSALRNFAYNADSTSNVQNETESENQFIPTIAHIPHVKDEDESSLSSANTTDIEDLLGPPTKRQKRSTSPAVLKASDTNRAPRKTKPIVKNESGPDEKPSSTKAPRRMPARKTRGEDGEVKIEPPSNWEVMYDTVKKMREDNPTAPVDTMGCAELYWRASSAKDRRFQTLIALMLSSQTKDTVTAVAMQRLHTELGQGAEATMDTVKIKSEDDDKDSATKDSTLNLENILAVSPTKLNELIRTVGFHNNKTKYIKAAALILRDQHDGDIPPTPEELMSLPGVGPKMAYLCMSAAWGKHEGIGVDVHVHRITNLWGWNKTKNPEETRKALQSWLPRDKWHEINKLLVGLGQTVCLPVKRRCGECYLAGTKLCMSEIKGLSNANARANGIKMEAKIEVKTEPKIKIESV